MKILAFTNGSWKQKNNLSLTNEEKSLMQNLQEGKKVEKKGLASKIKNDEWSNPSSEDSASTQTIYDNNKIEGARLISAEIFLPDGNGIINCRINGEHKQIRF